MTVLPNPFADVLLLDGWPVFADFLVVSEQEDGVVGVPSEGAVLPGVRAIVHIVRALGRGVVGAAAGRKREKKCCQ